MINNVLLKYTTAQLFFISVVLVFSHCSIRNFLEESNDFQSFKISSKHQNSQKILPVCIDAQIKNDNFTKLEISKNWHPETLNFSNQNLLFFKTYDKALVADIKSSFKVIPYYILYQNMRCYLS